MKATGALGLDALGELVGLKLRFAQMHVFGAFFADFAPEAITPAEFAILYLVARNPGVRQGRLGETLSIKRSNLTKLVRGLEARGLLDRHALAGDGRALGMRLTAAGQALVQSMLPRVEQSDRAATGRLTQAERSKLLALLDRLAGASEPDKKEPLP